jgi:large subunit ribosomal protein L28
MPRRCQLTGTLPQFGHNVSHSNIKTHRRFNPNLQHATLYSEVLRRTVPLRVTTRALRSVQKGGGLDAWLLQTDDRKLAPEGLRLKHQIKRALARGRRRRQAQAQA